MASDHNYEIRIFQGSASTDPTNDNVDVEVHFDDGRRYGATFFTLANIEHLLHKYRETGECASGLYFWAQDMIIIKRLIHVDIANAIADLISDHLFEKAFSLLSD